MRLGFHRLGGPVDSCGVSRFFSGIGPLQHVFLCFQRGDRTKWLVWSCPFWVVHSNHGNGGRVPSKQRQKENQRGKCGLQKSRHTHISPWVVTIIPEMSKETWRPRCMPLKGGVLHRSGVKHEDEIQGSLRNHGYGCYNGFPTKKGGQFLFYQGH